jgi:hypothetical protein
VRLAIRAPATEPVYRGEVWDAIARSNRDAASASLDVEALEVPSVPVGSSGEGGSA